MNNVKERAKYIPGLKWKRMGLGGQSRESRKRDWEGRMGGGYCQDAKQIDEYKRKKEGNSRMNNN